MLSMLWVILYLVPVDSLRYRVGISSSYRSQTEKIVLIYLLNIIIQYNAVLYIWSSNVPVVNLYRALYIYTCIPVHTVPRVVVDLRGGRLISELISLSVGSE